MTDPCVFVVKPGAIKGSDKSALRKAGIVVVEADDPASVRFIRPNADVSSTQMLRCAMQAINEHDCNAHKARFVKLLMEVILAEHGLPPLGKKS